MTQTRQVQAILKPGLNLDTHTQYPLPFWELEKTKNYKIPFSHVVRHRIFFQL